MLSPAATEIEVQTVRWIAELIGYPSELRRPAGERRQHGQHRLLARGARRARRVGCAQGGVAAAAARCVVYGSAETHTWIQKAADLAGLGTDAIRWIPTDAEQRMDVDALRPAIDADVAAGHLPFMVVGTGGSVSTGAVDPLPEIAAVCREHGIWFHVDGAYGGFAAALPDAPDALRALSRRGLGGRRSAQVAVRAARGRLRAGPRSGDAARRLRVPPAVLPLRRAGDELRGLRAAELARLPRAQGVAGPAAGRRRRLPADDLGRHPAVARDGGRRPRAPGTASC